MADRRSRSRTEREARRRSQAYAVRQAVHERRGARRRRDDRVAAGAFALVLGAAIVAQTAYFTLGPGAPAATQTPMPTPTSSASTTPSADPSP